jgi:hypothetical protein
MTPHLTSHHRRTVEKIFAHPTSGNIEWRQVESLLAAIGQVESEGNGKLHISVALSRRSSWHRTARTRASRQSLTSERC